MNVHGMGATDTSSAVDPAPTLEVLTMEKVEEARRALMRMPLDARAAKLLVFLEDRAVNDGGMFHVKRLYKGEQATLDRLQRDGHIRVESIVERFGRERGDPTHVVTLLSYWAWEQAWAARKLKATGKWSMLTELAAKQLEDGEQPQEHEHESANGHE